MAIDVAHHEEPAPVPPPRPDGQGSWLRNLSARARGRWTVVLAVIVLVLLVMVPLGLLLMTSARTGTPGNLGDWTFAAYRRAFVNPLTYQAFRNTMAVALVGTAISLVLAFVFAWLIERTNMPFRNFSFTVLLLPIALPSILFVLAWTTLLAPRSGLLNVELRQLMGIFGSQSVEGPFNIYSLGGVIFLDGMRGITTIFVMLIAAFRLFDPALEEAAKVSGAGTFATVGRVTMPVLVPAIMAASVYSFISSLDQFEAALVAGLPGGVFLIPTLIFFTVQMRAPADYALSAVYSVLFMVLMLLLLILYRRVVRRSERFATVSGKGYRPRRIDLGKLRYPAFLLVLIYGFVTVLLPLLVLGWLSLRPQGAPLALGREDVQFTLHAYVDLFTNPRNLTILWNTLKALTATATLTMLIAFLVSWAIVRGHGRARGVLDGLSFLPYAFPGVTVGIAAIFVFLNPPGRYLQVYGTITILVLAMTVQYVAFATRLMNGAVAQIKQELEDAGSVAGAKHLAVMWRITFPLLAPAVLSGWIWVAAHSMRTFSIPLVLSSRGNEVIAPAIWRVWQRGNIPGAAAWGIVLTAILIPLTIVMRRLMSGNTESRS